MMKICRYIFLILSIHVTVNVSAQEAPKYSNEFLSIGVGARALGMSKSQVAHVNDITSAYWNPAGLTNMTGDYQFSLMHSEYFAGIAKYDYAGIGVRLDSSSVLAANLIRFAVDDIPDTRFLYDANGGINYDNIQFFSAADYGFLVSYARRLNLLEGLNVGGSVKVVHRKAGEFATAWGFGLDAGAQMKYRKWQFGLMLRDISGTFNAWDHNEEELTDTFSQTGNDIPQNSVEVTLPKAILGAARYIPIKTNFGVLASIDLITTFDGQRNTVISVDPISLDPALGIEFDFKKMVFLRFGAGNVQQTTDFDLSQSWSFEPNFGIGIQFKQVTLDYALSDIGDQSVSPYSHVFSLKAYLLKDEK